MSGATRALDSSGPSLPTRLCNKSQLFGLPLQEDESGPQPLLEPGSPHPCSHPIASLLRTTLLPAPSPVLVRPGPPALTLTSPCNCRRYWLLINLWNRMMKAILYPGWKYSLFYLTSSGTVTKHPLHDREMAQCVKMIAATSDVLSLTSRTHV